MGNFQNLRVWQSAKELAIKIYKLTQNPLQRSAVSIPSNIAEGDESGTDKLSVRYFFIAKGSTAELLTQLIIANEIGYIENTAKNSLVDECDKISAMLSKLINARNKNL
jgi:four helix bundle protein